MNFHYTCFITLITQRNKHLETCICLQNNSVFKKKKKLPCSKHKTMFIRRRYLTIIDQIKMYNYLSVLKYLYNVIKSTTNQIY